MADRPGQQEGHLGHASRVPVRFTVAQVEGTRPAFNRGVVGGDELAVQVLAHGGTGADVSDGRQDLQILLGQARGFRDAHLADARPADIIGTIHSGWSVAVCGSSTGAATSEAARTVASADSRSAPTWSRMIAGTSETLRTSRSA